MLLHIRCKGRVVKAQILYESLCELLPTHRTFLIMINMERRVPFS